MPPPPAPPPPLMFGGSRNNQVTKSSHSEPPPDRNALLSQIRKGARLKKVETNDRSAPLVDNNKSSNAGGSGNNSFKANGTMPVIPPGGLFSQGIPKLRSTASRTGEGDMLRNYQPSNKTLNTTNTLSTSLIGRSHSQPPSPVAKLRQATSSSHSQVESLSHRSFPSDVNVKGPAPAPPPANQKPNFVTKQVSNYNSTANRHPTVKRSASQTHIGPRVIPSRPPPSVRPPPPPKSATVLQSAPPAPPSKPPNVMRRQSFGVGDTYSSHQLSIANNDVSKFSIPKSLMPPPPPRNNSAPNNLNQMNTSSPTSTHVNKMATAPPPPPSRPASGHMRAPTMRPPPPPMRAPAPPPPPHRLPMHPAPPSQLKATPSHGAVPPPPPPVRITSVMNPQQLETISDFEARFLHKFHSAQSLPAPEKYTNMQKTYPSKVQELKRSTRRQPPPPPPLLSNGPTSSTRGSSNHHHPFLHIQLEPRVFANNTAHC